MKHRILLTVLAGLLASCLQAQVCDPAVAPTGLTSTYTPGSGALLAWDAVPGSVGVQLRIQIPSGSTINRRIVGPEVDQLFVPDALLTVGAYTWRVQAACSTVPPFAVTPISASNSFTVGSGSSCPATVTDIDGNSYNTVQIGGQCWMAENLKVEHYRDTSNIPTGLSNSAWGSSSSGAYAVYNNLAANKAIYGLLYNWYAVDDSRGLCPTGWHVPTDGEWTELTNHLGGELVAGGQMKTTGILSDGTGLWTSPNVAATNSSGFSGLPGGGRLGIGGVFLTQGNTGYWWSSSEDSAFPVAAWYRQLSCCIGNASRLNTGKQDGFSVRCLRD